MHIFSKSINSKWESLIPVWKSEEKRFCVAYDISAFRYIELEFSLAIKIGGQEAISTCIYSYG